MLTQNVSKFQKPEDIWSIKWFVTERDMLNIANQFLGPIAPLPQASNVGWSPSRFVSQLAPQPPGAHNAISSEDKAGSKSVHNYQELRTCATTSFLLTRVSTQAMGIRDLIQETETMVESTLGQETLIMVRFNALNPGSS
jgi:hypothetical protein